MSSTPMQQRQQRLRRPLSGHSPSRRSSQRLSIPLTPDGLYTFFSEESLESLMRSRPASTVPPLPTIPPPRHLFLHRNAPIDESPPLPPPPPSHPARKPNPQVPAPSPFPHDSPSPSSPWKPLPPLPLGPTRSNLQTSLTMLALCLSSFLAALDTVILTTALPTITSSLSISNSGFSWIGSSFLIACAASMPIWGKTSDIFGRKPILVVTNALFMLGSLICALSHTLGVLLLGRAVQGVGAGGLLTLPNIVISDLFSLRERGFYLSIVGMTWAVASALGAVVGGAFAERVSWRWCFWINLPCEVVSIGLLVGFLRVHNPRTGVWEGLRAIDWLGAVTITAATVMFLLGLGLGGVSYAWDSATVVSLIMSGALMYVVFGLVEWKIAVRPLLPPRIFANRSTAGVLGVIFSHGTGYIASCYFLPLYFQEVLGAAPLLAGTWFLVTAGVLGLTAILSGKYMQNTGRYLEVIYFGAMMLSLGFTLFTNFPPHRSWMRIIIYQTLVAMGMGTLFQAPLIALQTSLAPEDIAAGSAACAAMRQLASGISIVVGQVLFQAKMSDQYIPFIQAGVNESLAVALANGDTISTTWRVRQLPTDAKLLVESAISDSLAKMWIFYAAMGLMGLLASFSIARKQLSLEHVEHKTGLDCDTQKDRSSLPFSIESKEIQV